MFCPCAGAVGPFALESTAALPELVARLVRREKTLTILVVVLFSHEIFCTARLFIECFCRSIRDSISSVTCDKTRIRLPGAANAYGFF